MAIKKTATEIWAEYDDGMEYKSNLELFDTVKRNNDFYNDKQWEGVNAPDLDKPVFNMIKPAINYYVSLLVSDDVGVSISKFDDVGDVETATMESILSNEVDKVFEAEKFSYITRQALKTCAIDGDVAMYTYFDPDIDTGNEWSGAIKMELIDNTNLIFANTNLNDVQQQPYIIVVSRKLTDDVKAEAEENGEDVDAVVSDSLSYTEDGNSSSDTKYTTVLTKFWKQDGIVQAIKCTEKTIIAPEWSTDIRDYPIAWMSWEKVKNSYHGVSPITGKIQNQIFVNKIFAMAMEYQKKMAFPKIIYDRTKIKTYSNKIGEAIAVNGDPRESIFSSQVNPSMNNQAIELAEKTIEKTKDSMGVYDTALGNARPENTSAIVALQKLASQPLDLQRLDYFQFVEDIVRTIVDYMTIYYGVRDVAQTIVVPDQMTGESINVTVMDSFDFSELVNIDRKVKVDIGSSSYFSELTQIQTLDNLFDKNIIPDAITYLEAIPNGYVKNKQKIIEAIKKANDKIEMEKQQQLQQQQLGQQQQQPQMAQQMPQY